MIDLAQGAGLENVRTRPQLMENKSVRDLVMSLKFVTQAHVQVNFIRYTLLYIDQGVYILKNQPTCKDGHPRMEVDFVHIHTKGNRQECI